MSASSTISVKRFVPNFARNTDEQLALNGYLIQAALANDPDLVLLYLSQGANPSSTAEIGFKFVPKSAVAPTDPQNSQNGVAQNSASAPVNADNFSFPADAKFSAMSPLETTRICALHAAIINCCWSIPAVYNPAARINSAVSKVALTVKALLEAGANTSQRYSFYVCHIPGHPYSEVADATPLDLALHLKVAVLGNYGHAGAQELQRIVDLLSAPAQPAAGVKGNWVANVDCELPQSIHATTLNSLRVMLNSASKRFSDIVFECPLEILATAPELDLSDDSGSSVSADQIEQPAKRAKTSATPSSPSLSSGELTSDSSTVSGSASSSTPCNLVHAHRNILSASSPYFDTLFSGSWRDVSDGRIVAKQDARTIRRMLDFIYTGDMTAAKALQMPFEDLFKLHEASAEYQIDALRAMTEAALAQNVSASNLARMLQLASLHDGTSCTYGQISSSPATTLSSPSSLLSPTASSSSSSSSSSSTSASMAPCMLMNACLAVLQDDMTLFTSDGVIDFLAGQPKLRTYLRAVLVKRT